MSVIWFNTFNLADNVLWQTTPFLLHVSNNVLGDFNLLWETLPCNVIPDSSYFNGLFTILYIKYLMQYAISSFSLLYPIAS